MVRRHVGHGHGTAAFVLGAGEVLVLQRLHESAMRLPFQLRFHSACLPCDLGCLIPPLSSGAAANVASAAHVVMTLPSSLVFHTIWMWMVASLRCAAGA